MIEILIWFAVGCGVAVVSLMVVFWLMLVFGKNRNLK